MCRRMEWVFQARLHIAGAIRACRKPILGIFAQHLVHPCFRIRVDVIRPFVLAFADGLGLVSELQLAHSVWAHAPDT